MAEHRYEGYEVCTICGSGLMTHSERVIGVCTICVFSGSKTSIPSPEYDFGEDEEDGNEEGTGPGPKRIPG